MSKIQTTAFTTIVVFLLLIAACGGEGTESSGQVRGLVLDVQARSLMDIQSLTLRDSDGKLWLFMGDTFEGMSTSHLRDHILGGSPVTVFYRQLGDNLVVTDISD